jgi:hypothetical protein
MLGNNQVTVIATIRDKGYDPSNNSYYYKLVIPYFDTSLHLDSVIIKGRFVLISENEILAKYYYTQGRESPVYQKLYFTLKN